MTLWFYPHVNSHVEANQKETPGFIDSIALVFARVPFFSLSLVPVSVLAITHVTYVARFVSQEACVGTYEDNTSMKLIFPFIILSPHRFSVSHSLPSLLRPGAPFPSSDRHLRLSAAGTSRRRSTGLAGEPWARTTVSSNKNTHWSISAERANSQAQRSDQGSPRDLGPRLPLKIASR